MRKKSAPGAANFWPGYVDAMTNVVLNLLFMVAMFGISLAVFNATPQGRGEVEDGSDTGTLARGSAVPPSPGAQARGTRMAVNIGRPGAAGGAVPARPPAGAPISEAAAVPGPGGIAPPAFSVRPSDQILVADSYRRKGGPEVRVSQRTNDTGDVVTVLDVPAGADPVTALARETLAASLDKAVPGGSGRLLVWTAVEPDDQPARRTAYLLLTGVRNVLLQNGHDTRAIETRMLPGRARTEAGMKIFILYRKANGPEQPQVAALAPK